MPGSDEWQGRVGDAWATQWARTDRSFSELTPHLVDAITAHDFESAIDIGCGAGELSLRVAGACPSARITGVDVSPSLIEAARVRAGENSRISFELADASTWQPENRVLVDALISRHGVMFFDDPVAAFANLRGQTSPSGARLTFSCFRTILDNPFFAQVGALLPTAAVIPPADAPDPFAFADRDRVAAILSAAGWKHIEFERVDFPMIAGSGDDPVDDAVAYFERIGPAARALAQMDRLQQNAIVESIRGLAEANCVDGQVALSASVWIVTASSF